MATEFGAALVQLALWGLWAWGSLLPRPWCLKEAWSLWGPVRGPRPSCLLRLPVPIFYKTRKCPNKVMKLMIHLNIYTAKFTLATWIMQPRGANVQNTFRIYNKYLLIPNSYTKSSNGKLDGSLKLNSMYLFYCCSVAVSLHLIIASLIERWGPWKWDPDHPSSCLFLQEMPRWLSYHWAVLSDCSRPDPRPRRLSCIKPASEATSFSSWPGANSSSDAGDLPSCCSALPPLRLLLGGSPASSPLSAQEVILKYSIGKGESVYKGQTLPQPGD